MSIKVSSVVGRDAVSRDDGTALYKSIKASGWKRGVVIDFSGVDLVTPVFINSSLGRLCSEHGAEEVISSITLNNVSDECLDSMYTILSRYVRDESGFCLRVTNGEAN